MQDGTFFCWQTMQHPVMDWAGLPILCSIGKAGVVIQSLSAPHVEMRDLSALETFLKSHRNSRQHMATRCLSRCRVQTSWSGTEHDVALHDNVRGCARACMSPSVGLSGCYVCMRDAS